MKENICVKQDGGGSSEEFLIRGRDYSSEYDKYSLEIEKYSEVVTPEIFARLVIARRVLSIARLVMVAKLKCFEVMTL